VHIDMSSIRPDVAADWRGRQAAGIRVLDARSAAARPARVEAKLSIMVGAEPDDFAR
jgi:3-hydroxyisobutyrate dehydrogenase-like beta-hydroxyacid dehydrogenase